MGWEEKWAVNWEENGEKCEREVNGESVKVLPTNL